MLLWIASVPEIIVFKLSILPACSLSSHTFVYSDGFYHEIFFLSDQHVTDFLRVAFNCICLNDIILLNQKNVDKIQPCLQLLQLHLL